jgi:hypothetical protein
MQRPDGLGAAKVVHCSTRKTYPQAGIEGIWHGFPACGDFDQIARMSLINNNNLSADTGHPWKKQQQPSAR